MTNIDTVVLAMNKLEKELSETELCNLISFNHTYLLITEAVRSRLGKNYFDNDKLMILFDINFTRYYFNALKNYVDKRPCPPAWKVLFDNCKKNNSFQMIYMGLGVNAHVNNDLAFTLLDTIKAKEIYRNDYNKVNSIINSCVEEVISHIIEKPPFLNKLKMLLLPFYRQLLFIIIKRWRTNAWKAFEKLESRSIHAVKIEDKASKIANTLLSFRFESRTH